MALERLATPEYSGLGISLFNSMRKAGLQRTQLQQVKWQLQAVTEPTAPLEFTARKEKNASSTCSSKADSFCSYSKPRCASVRIASSAKN